MLFSRLPDPTRPTFPTTLGGLPRVPRPGRRREPFNSVYAAVRGLLYQLGYDRPALALPPGTRSAAWCTPVTGWSLSPTLVSPQHRAGGDPFSVITHPSVLRALADYVTALKGQGEIVIADNPSIDADWAALIALTRLDEFEAYYQAGRHLPRARSAPALDPPASPPMASALARWSAPGRPRRQHGAQPRPPILLRRAEPAAVPGRVHQTLGDHPPPPRRHPGISLSNTILNADVFISVPKLKTHHKVGVTLNVKGLVGINAKNKNYLVHWKIGTPALGGDEFRDPARRADYALLAARHLLLDWLPERAFLAARRRWHGTRLGVLFEDTRGLSFHQHRGAWAGNDTCWRIASNLYHLFVRDLPAGARPPGASHCGSSRWWMGSRRAKAMAVHADRQGCGRAGGWSRPAAGRC